MEGRRAPLTPFLRRVPVQAAFNGNCGDATHSNKACLYPATRVTGSLRSNRAKIPSLSLSLSHGFAVLTRNINRWKLWRSIQVSDGREKLSLNGKWLCRTVFEKRVPLFQRFARLPSVDSGGGEGVSIPDRLLNCPVTIDLSTALRDKGIRVSVRS